MTTTSQSTAAGRLIKLFFINIFILLLILATIELAIRIIFPHITPLGISRNLVKEHKYGNTFGLAPNVTGYSFGAKVVTDEQGFRIDPSRPPSNRKHSILVLGDSLSFGHGVAAADSFPLVLQNKLKDYRVINTSVFGYSALDYYNVLTYAINSGLEFDGVIVSICLNDFSDLSQDNIHEAFKQDTIEDSENKRYPNRFLRFLKNISDNYVDFNSILREYSRTFILIKSLIVDTPKNYYLADTAYYSVDLEKTIVHEFTAIYDLANKNDKWILFFICPYEYQLRSSFASLPDITRPQEIIKEAVIKEKLPIIDLFPMFKGYLDKFGKPASCLYLFADPMHFSLEGHQLVAECIYAEITRRRLAF